MSNFPYVHSPNTKIKSAEVNANNNAVWPTGWTDFTPTWTSPGGNPAIGGGTFTANWMQVGKLVTVQYHITIGVGTNVGASYWVIGLPVACVGDPYPVGIWNAYCAGAYTVGAIEMLNTTTFVCNWTGSANYVGLNQPGVWANTNWLRISINFEVS